MKTLFLAAGVAALLVAAAKPAAAAEMGNAPRIGRVSAVYVPPADDAAFRSGAKAFNTCLKEHGETWTWTLWDSVTANGNMYYAASFGHHWSDFDAENAASKACRSVFMSKVMPHFTKSKDMFLVNQPDLAHWKDGDWKYFHLYFLRIKPGRDHDFRSTMKKIAQAAKKENWLPFAVDEIRGGGKGAADYVVEAPFMKWADLAQDNPSMKDMLVKAYGEKEGTQTLDTLMDVIKKGWDQYIGYDKDLSYHPAKKSSD